MANLPIYFLFFFPSIIDLLPSNLPLEGLDPFAEALDHLTQALDLEELCLQLVTLAEDISQCLDLECGPVDNKARAFVGGVGRGSGLLAELWLG